MTGTPAPSTPGYTADGMPVGLQVFGPHFADLEVPTTVACLEDSLPFDRVAEVDRR